MTCHTLAKKCCITFRCKFIELKFTHRKKGAQAKADDDNADDDDDDEMMMMMTMWLFLLLLPRSAYVF